MKAELFALKNPPQETNSVEMECVPKEDPSPPVTIVTTSVRVCFLGWMEFYDDWIELNSTAGRLAPLNVKSLGNRGDNFIREEVKFLAKFWEKKNQLSSPPPSISPSSGEYAFSPEPALVSPFYASIVNKFFAETGISNFHQLLHERMVRLQLVSSSSAENSSNHSSSTKPSNLKLILSLGFAAEVLSRSLFDYSSRPSLPNISTTLISLVELSLEFLLREELRATKTEVLEQILISFEQILKSLGMNFENVSQKVDPLWVHVALECIKSPYLNRYTTITPPHTSDLPPSHTSALLDVSED
jgi:hypothetical protein